MSARFAIRTIPNENQLFPWWAILDKDKDVLAVHCAIELAHWRSVRRLHQSKGVEGRLKLRKKLEDALARLRKAFEHASRSIAV